MHPSGANLLPAQRTPQPQREILHLVDRLAVDRQEAVGPQQAFSVIDGRDDGLDHDGLVDRRVLAAVEPLMLLAQGHALETGVFRKTLPSSRAATFISWMKDSRPSEPGQTGSW